jgi:predicted transcriptional regulator
LFNTSGLTDDLLAVYRVLLQRPDLGHAARLKELAAELGRTKEETSRDLQKLRDLGLWRRAGTKVWSIHWIQRLSSVVSPNADNRRSTR